MADQEEEKVVVDQVTDDADVSADPSPATEQDVSDDEPQSMLDAVVAEVGEPSDPASENVDGEEKATPDPGPDANEDVKGAEAETSEVPEGDPTEEEMKNYSQKANSRIRKLVEERNDMASRASRGEPIVDFLEKNDIPNEDLDVILDLTAKLRQGDFAGFLQGVSPYVDLAQQYTGQVLPADLQQQVKQGYVSPEIATELAQRRAQNQVLQDNTARRSTSDQKQMAQNRADNIRVAVTDWEKQVAQTDPDYKLKADIVRRTSQAMMQEHGAPQSPQDALNMVKAAYEEVNGTVGKLRPAPKATRRGPSSTGQHGGTAPVAEPTSMMEAMQQALEAKRA